MAEGTMTVRVECYAGYRGEETPRRFSFAEREVEVAEVVSRWLTPDHRYFRLRGDDGGLYVLRQDCVSGRWEITMSNRNHQGVKIAMEQTGLIIVRHGETEWNLAGKRQGHLDSQLTARGVAQGKALAGRLANESFTVLYSSDLGRAHQTAKLISDSTGHAILVDERLRERNLGIFQGLTADEIQRTYPEEYRLHKANGPDYIIPRGESMRQQVHRNIICLEELAQKHAGEVIVIVTHGGVLSGLFRHTFSIPLEAPRRFEFMNASINVFSYGNGHLMMQTWGDVSHLDRIATFGDSDVSL